MQRERKRTKTGLTIHTIQPLDAKVLRQLETAVSKSSYVGQGKKLKVVPKVRTIRSSQTASP